MLNTPRLRFRERAVAFAVALCAALAVAATLAAGGEPGAPAVADAAAPCPLSQMSSGSQPACWQPFSGGPFNVELSSTPALASNSAAVVSHMTANNWWVGMSPSGFSLGVGGSRPVFFATASDPTMKIVCENANGAGSCTGANGVNLDGQTINVPPGAQSEGGYDGHLTVIETATGAEYDFWKATIQGSTIDAGAGSVVDANLGNGLGANGDAAGFALTGGLLRPSELASGVINHALVVTVPCTNATGADVGYSWPAMGGWGEVCGEYWNESPSGAPELGQLLRLNLSDQQIASSPAPAWQKTIMTALAHYGAYIEDTDGSSNNGIDVITQDSGSWTDLGLPDQWVAAAQQLGYSDGTLSSSVPIPVSELQVVNACAPEGTCPASVLAPPAPVAPSAALVAPASQPRSTAGASASGGRVDQKRHKAKGRRHKAKQREPKHRKHKAKHREQKHHKRTKHHRHHQHHQAARHTKKHKS
jgi:hypothetical protein